LRGLEDLRQLASLALDQMWGLVRPDRAEEAQINRELGEIANLRAKLEAELVEVAREIALAARRERSLVRRFFRWASAVTVH
jgi:hypothetical protein